MGKIWKICVNIYVGQFKKFHDKKWIFTCSENITWGWLGVHAAQMKLLPKFNFFWKNTQNVVED